MKRILLCVWAGSYRFKRPCTYIFMRSFLFFEITQQLLLAKSNAIKNCYFKYKFNQVLVVIFRTLSNCKTFYVFESLPFPIPKSSFDVIDVRDVGAVVANIYSPFFLWSRKMSKCILSCLLLRSSTFMVRSHVADLVNRICSHSKSNNESLEWRIPLSTTAKMCSQIWINVLKTNIEITV